VLKILLATRDHPGRRACVIDAAAPLYQRDDDRPESIKVRMEAYESSTIPLIDFYSSLGLLISVTATGSPESICTRTLAQLEPRR
jgi:adenylate kinase